MILSSSDRILCQELDSFYRLRPLGMCYRIDVVAFQFAVVLAFVEKDIIDEIFELDVLCAEEIVLAGDDANS